MTTATAPAPTGTTQPTGAPQDPPAPDKGTAAQPKDPPKPETGAPAGEEPDLLGGTDDKGTKETDSAPTQGEIEIKVPEGVEVDQALLDGFKTVAKDMKLDSAGAQKMVDLYVSAIDAQGKKLDAAWQDQRKQWRDAARTDKEIGGAAFEENVKLANKTLSKVAPELIPALKDLGIASHPEVIRLLVRVGKAMSEDSITVPGGGTAGAKDDADARLRASFPSMYPAEQ